ncbi:MAG: ABC transporter ATP-binding protein [Planctomycetia bacterium]|nr:ABC transporter ATP-binding protein [Planctomycetia bacterium]
MLLQTHNLTKRYGDFTALDSLSFDVKPGEVVGLLGPNGSGKTTALRLIMGFLSPTAGTARIAGHDCWVDSVAARQHVAYLPAELRLYENMTGRQLIRFLCDLRGATIDEDIFPLAKVFDIDIDRPIATMSSGMKRKVAILQVLAPRTPLVIMDEPTNALDPNMRDELIAQIGKARQRGQSVLFSSHILHEVEQVCDRVIVLRRGKLVHAQTMAELQAGRLINVRFERDAVLPPAMAGLHVRECHAERIAIEYVGPLPPVLEWLSGQAVRELRVEPLGLNAIYYRFHGNPDE